MHACTLISCGERYQYCPSILGFLDDQLRALHKVIFRRSIQCPKQSEIYP